MTAAFGLTNVVRPVKLSVQISTPHAAPGANLLSLAAADTVAGLGAFTSVFPVFPAIFEVRSPPAETVLSLLHRSSDVSLASCPGVVLVVHVPG